MTHIAHTSKTSVEIDLAKLEQVKAITGANSIRAAIERSWDRIIGLANQHDVIREIIDDPDPLPLDQIDGPHIRFRDDAEH
ncbi:hypothetical protein GCM10027059_11000 [Myceligenerans halotolerans]